MDTPTLTREQLRKRIDTMEQLESVLTAIDDVGVVEYDQDSINVTFSERSGEQHPVAFANGLPPSVVLVGLCAMQKELERQLSEAA